MVLTAPNDYQAVSGAPVLFLACPIHFAPAWHSEAFDLMCEVEGARGNTPVVVATPVPRFRPGRRCTA